MRSGKLPSFEKLLLSTPDGFCDDPRGTNYAQARYLCYYMQERGVLVEFCSRFRADSTRDPTGLEMLRAALGEPDLGAFKKKWEAYVLRLRYPSS